MLNPIFITRDDGSVLLVRSCVETATEDPLTVHEQVINELHGKLEQAEKFIEYMFWMKFCASCDKFVPHMATMGFCNKSTGCETKGCRIVDMQDKRCDEWIVNPEYVVVCNGVSNCTEQELSKQTDV